MTTADIGSTNYPKQRILSCLNPRADAINSNNVVSRSIKRLVDGNKLVGSSKSSDKHQPREHLFSCITPRTDSINAADIVVMPVNAVGEKTESNENLSSEKSGSVIDITFIYLFAIMMSQL